MASAACFFLSAKGLNVAAPRVGCTSASLRNRNEQKQMNKQMILEISDGEVIMGGFITSDDGYSRPVIFIEKNILGCIPDIEILFEASGTFRGISTKELEIMHAPCARDILENELMIYRAYQQKVNEAKESWKTVQGAAVRESVLSKLLADFTLPLAGGIVLAAFFAWLIS